MIAVSPLTDAEVSACEKKLKGGDANAARRYTKDAMLHYSSSMDELHRRRMVLGRVESSLVTPTECFGLLSALIGDKKGWDMAIDRLGASCDPGFGYLAWHSVLFYTQDQKRADNWMFAVKHAASMGHFPAKAQILKQNLRTAGFFSRILIRWKLFTLELKRQKRARADPLDRRLATFIPGNEIRI